MKRQTTGAWAASLTSLFWERRSGELAAAAPDLLVAVPMHRWRRIRRGVNPAQAIAERLARLLEKPFVPGALVQCRRTKPQHWLTAAQRRRNVKNAFRVSRNNWRIRGKRVLLVDDVMTTGTTCDEIAGVLLEAGAVEVRVAVLARGTGGKKSHR
jgi:ComF family protein